MASEAWKVTYEIVKVNRQPHQKSPDLIKEHRQNIPGVLKRIAEQLADKFEAKTQGFVQASNSEGISLIILSLSHR